MISKQEVNEIHSNMSAGINRLTTVMNDTEDKLMLGQTLEIEQCIQFMQEVKAIADKELEPKAVVTVAHA